MLVYTKTELQNHKINSIKKNNLLMYIKFSHQLLTNQIAKNLTRVDDCFLKNITLFSLPRILAYSFKTKGKKLLWNLVFRLNKVPKFRNFSIHYELLTLYRANLSAQVVIGL